MTPQRPPEQPGRERGVPALLDVAEAERHTVRGDAQRRAAQVLIEPVHDEAALHFLAEASGQHDHDREDDGVAPRLHHRFERIARDVVEVRRERQQQPEEENRRHEHDRHQGDPEECLAEHRPMAEQDVPDPLAAGADQKGDERQEEHRVEQRQDEHERGISPPEAVLMLIPRLVRMTTRINWVG